MTLCLFPYFLLNYACQINQKYPPCVSQAPVLAPSDLDHPLIQTLIMQEVVTRDSPLTLSVFNLSSSNLFCYKSMCKWCSALHNPMVWPMLHISCLIGLGSSSESSRLRTILWYICQQSDDRWVDTKGKTSSRLDGACSICFKRRKNLWAQFSMWKQISERCVASLVVLLCWGQRQLLFCGPSCLVISLYFPWLYGHAV